MFKKILVANRGEIACRVFRTAKSMGIGTVAVYSVADANALHVSTADEAICIGPAAASESYLSIDAIVQACKQAGADAVHPGYGFLSERSEFARRLAEEGVAFIGPPSSEIEAMGDKITSKKLAAQAGVSTVPGHMGLISDPEHAAKIATEIGYPVMIKASAGGGGKGMRIAWNDAEARDGFERSKAEAASSFGDDRIFIEKFVTNPRHIEIQVLADSRGNTIYLGERECSIQRRNQKVVEEAPSPFLTEATRKAMGEQAVALAKAVGYVSAGTVEFIVDEKQNFYFLEMNTRLQVEHPVTELVTGIDLVEQMIRIAAGETLALSQDDVRLKGWAVESRVYAEDPYRNFLPSIGRIVRYRPPNDGVTSNGSVVRNDTGVFEGAEISMHYDPMIAKLCTWGETRNVAIDAMASALDQFVIDGVGHNIPFLSALMGHPRFHSGALTTGFIAEEFPDGFCGVDPSEEDLVRLAAIGARLFNCARTLSVSVSGAAAARSSSGSPKEDFVVFCNRRSWHVRFTDEQDPRLIEVEGRIFSIDTNWRPGEMLAQILLDGEALFIRPETRASGMRLRQRGMDVDLTILPQRHAGFWKLMPEKVPPDTSNLLMCPMPGLLVSLLVEAGDEVEEGQALAVVEAMKMQNTLRSQRSGRIEKICAAPGASLAVDEVILEFGV